MWIKTHCGARIGNWWGFCDTKRRKIINLRVEKKGELFRQEDDKKLDMRRCSKSLFEQKSTTNCQKEKEEGKKEENYPVKHKVRASDCRSKMMEDREVDEEILIPKFPLLREKKEQ